MSQVITSAEQAKDLCLILHKLEIQALSHPPDLPDGTVILAVYSPELEIECGALCLHMPTQELVRLFQNHYPPDETDVVIHGLKAWLKFFSERGRISFDSPRFRCTRLLAYLLDPPERAEEESDRDLTLQALVNRYLGTPYPLWGIWLKGKSYPEALYQRLWEDARYTYQLWKKFMDQVDPVDDAEFLHRYYDVELPMLRILLDMELQGIRVDRDRAAGCPGGAKEELESLQDQITALVGSWVNPNSHQEVRKFFSELKGEPFTGPINDQIFLDLAVVILPSALCLGTANFPVT
jgi:DNA polymerase I-like protein with 3'-5' exonuclease and polymerase domains